MVQDENNKTCLSGNNYRPMSRLTWCCKNPEFGKYYDSYRSHQRHKKEAHEHPSHKCGCGLTFKRLEYLIIHKKKWVREETSTQTGVIPDRSITSIHHPNKLLNEELKSFLTF
jgi:hypothetical protein